MNKVLVPILALATAGGCVFAYLEKSRADALETETASLKAELARLQSDLKSAQSKSDELAALRDNIDRLKKERDDAVVRSKSGGTPNPGAPGSGGAPGQGPDMRAMMQGFARQMDDPEVRKTMKTQQQQMIARQYEAIFKKLNLSEEDAKLVAELLGDRNFSAMDKGRKLLSGKMDDATLKQARQEILETKAETSAKLKGMLGEDKFSALSEFEQTAGDQRSLDSIARNFESKQMALQPQQKESLAAIMKEERLKLPNEEIPDMGGGPGMSVLLTDEEMKTRQQQEDTYQSTVLSRAGQAGLSPDQINGLKQSFDERNQRRAMGRIMGRAFLGGGR